jgi:hypothetical protein
MSRALRDPTNEEFGGDKIEVADQPESITLHPITFFFFVAFIVLAFGCGVRYDGRVIAA